MHVDDKIWLVSIELKSWVLPSRTDRSISYEEVIAPNAWLAMRAAEKQFGDKCSYSPVMRRKLQELNISKHSCYPSEAVELES